MIACWKNQVEKRNIQLRWVASLNDLKRTHCCRREVFALVCFSQEKFIDNTPNTLKAAQSGHANRPSFDVEMDVFSTRSSIPETPASWPPRPALTVLSPTCVAGRVVPHFSSFFVLFLIHHGCFEPYPNHSLPVALLALRPRPEAIRGGFENQTSYSSIISAYSKIGLSDAEWHTFWNEWLCFRNFSQNRKK